MRKKINKKARDKIAKICEKNDWRWCWFGFEKCMMEAHAPAHRHERAWYYDKPDKTLWDINQWMPSCQSCHHEIDKELSKEYREAIFIKLRGKEKFSK